MTTESVRLSRSTIIDAITSELRRRTVADLVDLLDALRDGPRYVLTASGADAEPGR